MSHFPLIQLPTFGDDRGTLTVLEGKLPFPVVRTYWIYGTGDQTRGGHRHRQSRQALVAVAGSVQVYMNDGIVEELVDLKSPSFCLLVEPKDWHTMTFSEGAVLLVMSSHPYDRVDYIDTPYERPEDTR
jgi:dTDP-4-dehydrorhamnose 3,5-epimerase-like enzyme